MKKELFIVDRIKIGESFYLNLLLEKDMSLKELYECYIQVFIQLDETRVYKKTQKVRFVIKDKIITFDKLMHIVVKLLEETKKIIEAIDSGVNLTQEFYLETPGIDNVPVETRKELKKQVANITEYQLQPFIIKLYTILTSYKGTDTLQQRKFREMIKNQEYLRNMKGMF